MDCTPWLKFLSNDSGCGSLFFGYIRQFSCFLGLFFLFCLGFGFKDNSSLNILSRKCGILNFLKNPNQPKFEILNSNKECRSNNSDDGYDENEEFNISKLRHLVKIERDRANAACVELEKERMATASAAEETMAMILRLQREKSLVEMEAKQYRRVAEEKQLHDQDVIQSLKWIAMKHDNEKKILKSQVEIMKQKLKLDNVDAKGGESEETDESINFSSVFCEGAIAHGLISSLNTSF